MPPRLRQSERAILCGFAVLWLFAMAMRFNSLGHQPPHWVYVNAMGNGDYPVVRGFMNPESPESTELEIGDRIMRVGDTDLRGRGQIGFIMAVSEAAWNEGAAVPFVVERDGAELRFDEIPAEYPGSKRTGLVIAFVWGAVAIIIFARAPPSVTTRALFWMAASHSLMYAASFDGPPPIFAISLIFAFVATVLALPLMVRGYLTFPQEVNALHGFNRVWPWFFALGGFFLFAEAVAVPLRPEVVRPWIAPTIIAFILASVAILTHNFLRSGPVGRRKVKWVLFQAYLGMLSTFVVYFFHGVAAGHQPLWANLTILFGSAGFPIVFLIAVMKFDLFDIDRILGATVSYNVLAIVVVGLGVLLLPPLTDFLAQSLSVGPTVGRSGVAVGLAGMALFANSRLRPQVDRIFFKERFALAEAMESLPERLAAARAPADLWSMTGSELVEHIRPASCVIFVSAGEAFVPTFVDGDTVPPPIAADSELVRGLSSVRAASSVDRKFLREFGAEGRAVLANLEVRLIMPVHRSGEMEAFVCLGEKRSGDIYTHTDLTLITTLGKSLSIHLLRFSEAELLERSRGIQEKMRRYVPGAVADEIASGHELEAGEKEVSVLFVDIRGYTAYSDGRDASDTFSTVNRYTELVSTIVSDAGGVVVEFNGDGMMAVFGAPRPLEEKETAAVSAARMLVEEVPKMHRSEADMPLSVGVGVSTGAAFVGNIEAVDRVIWTVIGSTTNLAARLQSLTRDLGMGILIDELTRTRSGETSTGFSRYEGIEIRGRKGAATVFGLALPDPPA